MIPQLITKHKVKILCIIVFKLFLFAESFAQENCGAGYVKIFIKCNGKITSRCVESRGSCGCHRWHIDYYCKETTNKIWGSDSYDTYMEVETALERNLKKSPSSADCFEQYSKHSEIYCIDNSLCGNPCAGVKVQEKRELSNNATIMIQRFRNEISDARNKTYTTGKVFDEYERRLDASEALVKKFESAFNNSNNRCLDEMQKAYDDISKEETSFNNYSKTYQAQMVKEMASQDKKVKEMKEKGFNGSEPDNNNTSNFSKSNSTSNPNGQSQTKGEEFRKWQQQFNKEQELKAKKRDEFSQNVGNSLNAIGSFVNSLNATKHDKVMESLNNSFKKEDELYEKKRELNLKASELFIKKDIENFTSASMESLVIQAILSYNSISLDIDADNFIRKNYFSTYDSFDAMHDFESVDFFNSLPDLFHVPLCKVNGKSKLDRNKNFQHAFLFLVRCEKCSELKFMGNKLKTKCNEKTIQEYNEDSAVVLLKTAIRSEILKNKSDLFDYFQANLFTAYLINKNAKTFGDLYSGINFILEFYNTYSAKCAPLIGDVDYDQVDASILKAEFEIITVYFINFYARIIYNSVDSNQKKWAAECIDYSKYRLVGSLSTSKSHAKEQAKELEANFRHSVWNDYTGKYRTDSPFNIATSFYLNGSYKISIEEYDKLIRTNPDNASLYYCRGLAKYYAGENGAALFDFEIAKQKGYEIR